MTEAEQRAATYRKALEAEIARTKTAEEEEQMKVSRQRIRDELGSVRRVTACEEGLREMANQAADVAREQQQKANEQAVKKALAVPPVIRHPGKTHEEVLTFLADFPGHLGMTADEKDAVRWARGRLADLKGDVARYMAIIEAKDRELGLLREQRSALIQQVQAIVDYHQQGAA